MKRVLAIALLLFIAEALEAFEPRWRWRNDDGDIFHATWKDSVNCPIISHNGENIRLRTVAVPCDVPPADTPVTVSLRYKSTPYYDAEDGSDWTPVTRADTGIFFLSDSKYFDDGAWYPDNAFLNVWGDASCVAYLGTITIDSSSSYSLASKPHGGGYEFEYCLKANPTKLPDGSVYYFVSFLNEGIGPYDPDPPCLRFPPFYWKYHKVKTGQIINIQFMDSLNGWYQAYAEYNYGLWRTTDGGATWTMLGSQLWECPFFFATKDTGWAVIDDHFSRSTDGGATWTALVADSAVFYPNSIFFLDTKHGWATCRTDPMLRTSDGGFTWEPVRSLTANLLSTYFLNERVGFAIGESIYKTTDGGSSWRLVKPIYELSQGADAHSKAGTNRRPGQTANPLTPYVGQIQFVDSSLGWALTYNGKLCRTVDAGEHWTLAQTFRTPRALAMHFSDGLTGWIVGEQGMILATKDGGTTWEKRPSGTGHDLRTIEAVNDHLWIGAKDGTLLSSASGGWLTTLEEKKASALPEDCVLSQNYPNPFNPQTTIRYALPKAAHVTIKVFDILGREVSTLVDEQKSSGVYETSWNGTRCASGIYLCRMQAGAYQRVRLMALVK